MQATEAVDKLCKKCGVRKPLGEFYVRQEASDGRKSPCRVCCRKNVKEWKRKNRQKSRELARSYRKRHRSSLRERYIERAKIHGVAMAEYRRRWNLAKRYGITVEDFFDILEAQGGCCGICERHLPKGSRNAVVDHCHKTGQVRGVLCVSCNVALGKFKDSKEGLLKAIDYLERSENAAKKAV